MITDLLDNLHKYSVLYPSISEIIDFINEDDLNNLSIKTTSGRITLIPITSVENENFDKTLLEAHQSQMDIHITLKGEDKMAYACLNTESEPCKEYDNVNDYLLVKSNKIKVITIPEGYFCIIPNHFAHMAMYGISNSVKKIVIKIPAS